MNHSQNIMSDDLFNLFERELQNIGLFDQQEKSENQSYVGSSDSNTATLSMTEERSWMLHQQDPLASSGPFLLAFKLVGNIQLDRLVQAIKKLYSNDSNLNLIYHLDQQGELCKSHQNMHSMEVEIHLVASDNEAIKHLLALISTPIDLAHDTAIRFILMPKNNQELLVGILGHHILLDDTAWKPIFTYLSSFYNDDIQLAPVIKSIPIRKNSESQWIDYWKQQFPRGLNRVSWPQFIQRSHMLFEPVIEYGKTNNFHVEQKSVRVFTKVASVHLAELSQKAQCSMFHTMVSLFGFYLSSILDLDALDLFVPVVDQYDISSLSQINSSSNILPIRIERLGQNITEQIQYIRNQILQGISHNLPIEQILSATKTQRTAIPNILITQFVNSTQYLTLNHLYVESIIIPPIHSDYDLTLAFQFREDGQLHLELTTGEKLSRSVASLLLEQFAAFLTQDFQQNNIRLSAFSNLTKFASPSKNEQDADSILSIEVDPHQDKEVNLGIAELILAEFKSVLMNPQLTIHDHFFDQGGHSILATRILGKLKSQHQLSIKIADFFNAPTAYELSKYANYSDQSLAGRKKFDPNEHIIAPISLLQKAFMGFSDQGRDPIFNIPFAFRLSELVDEQAFYLAFIDLLERHHALRSLFIAHGSDDFSQSVVPLNQISSYPWFWYSDAQGQTSAQQILHQEAQHQFELTQEFPIRVRFLKDEQGRHILSLLLYHIAMDEWSSGILIKELLHAYSTRVQGQAPVWEKIPRQFHEYAVAQEDSILQEHLNYWINTIGKIKKYPPLFNDSNQPERNLNEDVSGASVEFSFNAQSTKQLYQLAKTYKSSIFYVVYAAIVLSIHFLGAGKKVLTGTSVACRENPDYQDTIGYFTNVVMHYTEFNEDMRIADLVQQVQNNIFNTLPYADIPFAIVEENIRAEDEKSNESPYEVYIQLHAKNALTGSFQLQDGHEIGFELLEPERDTAKFGLHFEVYEEPLSDNERLRVVINYRVNRYNSEQIDLIKCVTEQVLQIFTTLPSQHDSIDREPDVMQLRKQLAQINIH